MKKIRAKLPYLLLIGKNKRSRKSRTALQNLRMMVISQKLYHVRKTIGTVNLNGGEGRPHQRSKAVEFETAVTLAGISVLDLLSI